MKTFRELVRVRCTKAGLTIKLKFTGLAPNSQVGEQFDWKSILES